MLGKRETGKLAGGLKGRDDRRIISLDAIILPKLHRRVN